MGHLMIISVFEKSDLTYISIWLSYYCCGDYVLKVCFQISWIPLWILNKMKWHNFVINRRSQADTTQTSICEFVIILILLINQFSIYFLILLRCFVSCYHLVFAALCFLFNHKKLGRRERPVPVNLPRVSLGQGI